MTTSRTWLLLLLAASVTSQVTSDLLGGGHHPEDNDLCDCMEYWKCLLNGGAPRGQCPMSNKYCCFMPRTSRHHIKPLRLLTILPPAKRRKTCGTKGHDSNKEGVAEMAEWPWHSAILEKEEDLYVCGASLLDEHWLITAAHCVDDYAALGDRLHTVLKVRLGEYDVSSTSEPIGHEEIDVEDVIIHPQFDNATLVSDIALLRLKTPAKKQANVNAVCMPKHNHDAAFKGKRCYVTGWGRTNETSEHSVVLKEIPVPLWDRDSCDRALRTQFGPNYRIPDTALCAGAEGRDACDGDGGGPLVCEKEGFWYQVGIVSFGIGCGRKNIPGVYTRVSAFETWIVQSIHRFERR